MWFLDLRVLSQGGPVGDVKLTDGVNIRETPGAYLQLQQDIAGRDIFFFTHGFENNRKQGTLKIEELDRHLLMRPAPLLIGILWPGDGLLHLGVDYIVELGEADSAGRKLGAYIDAKFGGASSISFGSHSLGARVILQAVRNITSRRVRQYFILAGAIENDALAGSFADAARKIDRISVLYSYKDTVLQKLYPAGNFLGRLLDWSTPDVKTALGRSGCMPPPVPSMITANLQISPLFDYKHADYLTEDTVTGDFVIPCPLPGPTDPVPTVPNPPVTGKDDLWKPCWSAAMMSNLWR